MSTIGAITDVAISLTSPMREIFLHHPSISRKELFLSGLSIGKDILGTNTNTLFFAFFGGYLALLLWFKDHLSYSIGEMINSKVFSAGNAHDLLRWHWHCLNYSYCLLAKCTLFN